MKSEVKIRKKGKIDGKFILLPFTQGFRDRYLLYTFLEIARLFYFLIEGRQTRDIFWWKLFMEQFRLSFSLSQTEFRTSLFYRTLSVLAYLSHRVIRTQSRRSS